MRIGCVIVTFNPDNNIWIRIKQLLPKIDKLVIVDNFSKDKSNFTLIRNECKIEIIENNHNKGLATALNQGCELLYKEGYKLALLLDQDSMIQDNMVEELKLAKKLNLNASIVGPLIIPFDQVEESRKKQGIFIKPGKKQLFKREIIKFDEIKEVGFNITSGSLIDLKIWKKINGFDDRLFIEGIDDEYCLRSKQNGYNTVINGNAILYQQYGEMKLDNRQSKIWNPTNHSPIRYYYVYRNKILISKIYKREFPYYSNFQLISLIKKFITICMFEQRKTIKIKAILLGIIDGVNGISGEASNNRKHQLK